MERRSRRRRRRREELAAATEAVRDPELIEDQIEAALSKLDEESREIVVLRFLHDLEYREIAHVLGMSNVACRLRVHRAVARLRRDVGRNASFIVASLPLLADTANGRMALVDATTKAAAATGGLILSATAKTTTVVVLLVIAVGILWTRSRDPVNPMRASRAASAGAETPAKVDDVEGGERVGGDATAGRAHAGGTVPRSLTVTGTVRREDGTPIQGATIQAPGVDGAPSATTGPDGSYLLEQMPFGSYPLEASAPGRASSFKQANFNTGPGRVDFTLGASHEIRGRVTDQNGKPVAGARLRALLAPDRRDRLRDVKTTESGTFSFEDARAGRWWVELAPPSEGRWTGGREILVSAADSPLELRLLRTPPGPATLHVEIIEAATNKPVPAKRVVLLKTDAVGRSSNIPLGLTDGWFRAENLQPGRWLLLAETAGGPVRRSISILEGERNVHRTIEVGARGSIRGRAIPRSASERPPKLYLTTDPLHEGKWVRSASEYNLPVTDGFAVLTRDRGYAFRMDSIRSGMTVWLIVQGKNLYGRAKVVVGPDEQANVDVPALPSGTLTLRLPSGFRSRPVSFTCWPNDKPDWKQRLGAGHRGRASAGFLVPAGTAQWRVEYRDPNSGERMKLEGSVEVSPGQAIVVEPLSE